PPSAATRLGGSGGAATGGFELEVPVPTAVEAGGGGGGDDFACCDDAKVDNERRLRRPATPALASPPTEAIPAAARDILIVVVVLVPLVAGAEVGEGTTGALSSFPGGMPLPGPGSDFSAAAPTVTSAPAPSSASPVYFGGLDSTTAWPRSGTVGAVAATLLVLVLL
ncbi:unnamed protein product, partial [Ectocarpus sp. 12 AP-2014]